MIDWKETTLREVTEVQTGPFGSQLHEEDYVAEGTPIITVENLVNDYISHTTTTPQVSEDDKERLAKYTLNEGDIVFSRVGSVDRCGYVTAKEDGWLFSGRLLRVRPKKDVFNKYVFYWLSQHRVKEYVRKIAVGATMPSINTELLSQVPIAYPDLPEQKAIAAVLSSFDDKIELLRRQNKTLEEVAEILFHQWFIEGAKEEWEKGTIENLFILQRGFDLPIQKRVAGSHPIFAASGQCGYHNESKVKAPGVTTGRSGLLGKVFFVMDDFWPLNTSLFIKEYKIGTPLYSYFLLKTLNIDSFNAGSAVPTLNRNHVHNYNIHIPPKLLIEKFENTMIPNFQKIKSNNSQIQSLSKLRDTLLPKLMKGEIRVKGI